MLSHPVILWFRQDLRLQDNPAYHLALESGSPILPVFILDDENAGPWKRGAASRWWLHHSLHALNASLHGTLAVFKGDASQIIPELTDAVMAHAVFWNRCYEPWRIARDTKLKTTMEQSSFAVKTCNANLLYEPWAVKKKRWHPVQGFHPVFSQGLFGAGRTADTNGLAPQHTGIFSACKTITEY